MSAALSHQHMTVKHVLNHDIMHCTADGVQGNHLYSGRALGVTDPGDIIQLHPDLQPLWRDIESHYQRVGLPYSRNVIWNLDLGQLARHAGFRPSVFFYGPHEARVWGDSGWFETVDFINSKNNFMALAEELGVDAPKTICFNSVDAVTPEALQDVVFPCYLKAAISVSGVGIYRCDDGSELAQALTKFEPGVPVQIQEEVIAENFLNLQYIVEHGQLYRLAATEQILDGFVHQGNRHPASHEPWDIVEPMAEWMVKHGMQGIFAFDVAVAQTDRGLRFPAIECNPRFNGASYPTLIAAKMGIPEWYAVTFSTRHRKLADIDLSGLEYDHESGQGVILVNWGTVLAGKLMFLIAGSEHYQKMVQRELAARLD
ncbi:MAG: ATP-grasp domain-containing protein [Candidatus Thiodiazotropha weberae]|nr:ATP-grasp domain-containing protein [Candidatus Thiodiazotropha endoloripes]MCG7900587.1 ATP-grasp domain-containing protein [Candidatus Thiodiazotropha weberae]